MLPLRTQARVRGVQGDRTLKVLSLEEARRTSLARSECLLWLGESQEAAGGLGPDWAGVIAPDGVEVPDSLDFVRIDQVRTTGVVAPGDVIRVSEGSSRVSVLWRRGSPNNTLLATERCNSFCLMCSQPPNTENDGWLVDEMLATIPLIDREEQQLGISGGEPTLLNDGLIAVIHQAKTNLPETELHILSNGRAFQDESLARAVAAVKHPRLIYGIPLYSADPKTHDYIVQSRGAWGETLAGLYNLARFNVFIELRIVVQKSNVGDLCELAYFIFRNLSFVSHVAFMGLEPIGFARVNYERVWVDPADFADELTDAVFFLANRGMDVSIYNLPLCALPHALWKFSAQSISDWKNVYLEECESCDLKSQCAGYFKSVTPNWISRSFKPIRFNAAQELESVGEGKDA